MGTTISRHNTGGAATRKPYTIEELHQMVAEGERLFAEGQFNLYFEHPTYLYVGAFIIGKETLLIILARVLC